MTTPHTLEPGHQYAYTPSPWLSQPLRVTVLQANGSEHSRVLIHHPDTHTTLAVLKNTTLTDEWSARPSEVTWPGYQGDQTWAQIAAESYVRVLEDRALAQRLTALGIERKLRHYAGEGGTTTEAAEADASLHLSTEELRYLLDLAEHGKEQEAATEES